MKHKGYAHETLFLFFKINCVPPKIEIYGSKDHTLESFREKFQEEDFQRKQT